jgi:hypothetical protein
MGPGLGLNVGGYGYAGAAVPTAASNPGSATVSQVAFGIGTSQTAAGPRTAAFGTMAAGAAGVAVLIFLWYSLPR